LLVRTDFGNKQDKCRDSALLGWYAMSFADVSGQPIDLIFKGQQMSRNIDYGLPLDAA
jgi:hypothetical protein